MSLSRSLTMLSFVPVTFGYDMVVKVIDVKFPSGTQQNTYVNNNYDLGSPGSANYPEPILQVTGGNNHETWYMPQIDGDALKEAETGYDYKADWSDVSDEYTMTWCDFSSGLLYFTLVDNDGNEDDLKRIGFPNMHNFDSFQSHYTDYTQIGQFIHSGAYTMDYSNHPIFANIPSFVNPVQDAFQEFDADLQVAEDLGHMTYAATDGYVAAVLKYSLQRFETARAPGCSADSSVHSPYGPWNLLIDFKKIRAVDMELDEGSPGFPDVYCNVWVDDMGGEHKTSKTVAKDAEADDEERVCYNNCFYTYDQDIELKYVPTGGEVIFNCWDDDWGSPRDYVGRFTLSPTYEVSQEPVEGMRFLDEYGDPEDYSDEYPGEDEHTNIIYTISMTKA